MTPSDEKQYAGFNWADKVALFVGFAVFGFIGCLWSLAFLVVGCVGVNHLWRYMGVQGIELALFVAGIAWGVLRGVDFVAGGSTYRLFR